MFLENQPILQKLYLLATWISRLATVNLLWLAFTLLGLGIFGIGPSTAAMSAVISRWIDGDNSFSVVRLFVNVYRKHFIKTNMIFLLLAIVGAVLLFNYSFIQSNGLPMFYSILTVTMGMIHLLISIIIIPLYINNNVSVVELFKTSTLFVIGYPVNSLIIVVATSGLVMIQLFMPGLLFFFSGSAITFVVILRIKKAIDKTRAIQDEIRESVNV
ncbi:YesL family protein [Halalkalibacter sp. AB-rgal2]|uniref:YesL family protein n=1 Tax=Halalkalibacter sp. AB-rgal2 TaxID=3242695 RepID=UPI00359D750F